MEKAQTILPHSDLQSADKKICDKLNRPLQDLRISVIDRCNFRCPYCMPEQEYSRYKFLDKKEWLTFDEIKRLAQLFTLLGVTKIRITGGEPLLRLNLVELINSLSDIPEIRDIALTTNGAFLSGYSKALKDAGLNRITISLDTLDPDIFRAMSGNKGEVEQILNAIKDAEDAGFDSLKINVVVQRGINDNSILGIIKYFKGSKHIVRFIEYMDVGTCNHWKSKYVVPSSEVLRMISRKYPIEPIEANYHGEVASRYKLSDGKGEIGFISSISQPFCGTCTRSRLSPDGKLYTCLFSSQGKDLKSLLRSGASDKDLLETIKESWNARDDRYSELRSQIGSNSNTQKKVEMFQIGG